MGGTGSMNAGGYPELPLPDAPGYSWARLLAQWVEGDPYQPEPETARYYETKARIAAHLKPTRVVEIGVRAGYSALAFHMGHPFTDYYGLDLDDGQWGGEPGYLTHAKQRIHALPLTATLDVGDSQQLKVLPPQGQGADLFHVDGDHSPKGAAHDIILAFYNGAKYVVVDDYDFTQHVTEAADWCIHRFGLTAWYAGDGGYRGNVVIESASLLAGSGANG